VGKLREVFPVWASDDTDQPQILGDYSVESDIVRFLPRYPVEPNLTPTARIQLSRMVRGGAHSNPVDIERRLTLLFDPGRIKRGLRPRADLGSALLAGKRYKLVVGDGMADATGNLLKNTAEVPLSVVEADRASPDPNR
jgi:hypothetical protein